jgi:hypothetical protein
MIITKKRPLYPEEEKMPLAKYYYNYPMHSPGPLEMQIIDNMNPMSPEDAIKPENFLDLLKPTGYDKMEMGYCMFPDGSGYIATYRVLPPHITPEMEKWYRRWRNFKSKSMVPGHGNLRYKIWMPADHVDHYFCNWIDAENGIMTEESLDLGEGDRAFVSVRHEFDLKEYGLSEERLKELRDAGCTLSGKGTYETFDEPGSHIQMSYSRPCPTGGIETRSREWIGWRPVNGKLVRDERTYVSEEYMRKVVIHNCIEWPHLYSMLPDLYAEYHNQPMDAD